MKAQISVLRSLTEVNNAADRLAFDDPEPDLDEVHPEGMGRGEVHDEPRVLVQPGLHVRVLVGGVVVHHQMQRHRFPVGVGHVAVGPLDLLRNAKNSW